VWDVVVGLCVWSCVCGCVVYVCVSSVCGVYVCACVCLLLAIVWLLPSFLYFAQKQTATVLLYIYIYTIYCMIVSVLYICICILRTLYHIGYICTYILYMYTWWLPNTNCMKFWLYFDDLWWSMSPKISKIQPQHRNCLCGTYLEACIYIRSLVDVQNCIQWSSIQWSSI